MARGFKAVVAAAEDISNRKNSGGGEFTRRKFFRIGSGDTAVVRFLEQGDDVTSVWCHQLPATGNRKFGPFVPCRDQDQETGERIGEDCPGCEDGLKKKFRGYINVLWRDAPVFATETDGEGREKTNYKKIVSNEDQVVIWETGIEVFEDLQILDTDWNGLSSREFKIRRKGDGLDTKYYISPADPDGGPTKVSKSDQTLIDEERYDLNELTSPGSYDTWGKFGGGQSKEITAVDSDASPFRQRQQED